MEGIDWPYLPRIVQVEEQPVAHEDLTIETLAVPSEQQVMRLAKAMAERALNKL